MRKIALTGNIGCGKTIISRVFESIGIPVFYADDEAKKLYSRDDISEKIKSVFGQSVFENNKISFSKLAKVIFSDKDKLKKIEPLIHPKVYSLFFEWTKQQKNVPYVIMETALVFENKMETHFDYVILVSCPKEIRIDRIMEKYQINYQDILSRMKYQMDEKIKIKKSHFVIVNDNKQEVLSQIMNIHKILSNH